MAPAPNPSSTPPSSAAADSEDFGANDWLLEDMYDRFVQDPESVDPSWATFFETHGKPGGEDVEAPTGTAQRSNGAGARQTKAAQGSSPTATPASGKAAAAPASVPSTNPPADPAVAAKPAGSRKATVEQPITNKEVQPEQRSIGALPADPPNPAVRPATSANLPTRTTLRGAPARTAKNMGISLSVPTATSVRSIPVKLLFDQRVVINNHLRRARGGKVSFTHLIGYAMIKALASVPQMNNSYDDVDGKPTMVVPAQINLGLAIDQAKPDGTRQLLVPSIKGCEDLDFAQFWAAYEDVVVKARKGTLAVDDFAGTTISLTNPGTIGTNHSVPRLMKGQGCIIGVGSMDYPPEFQGSSPDRLNELGVSKVLTLTSTYDHRVIQGAVSGDYLARLHKLLLGEDGFYDDIFESLRIPYEPIRWATDVSDRHEDQISKQARVMELINAYRTSGHLMADTDPLEYRQRSHHDLDVLTHGLTLWDLDREFATGSFGGTQALKPLRKILGILRDSYCRTIGIEYMHILEPRQRQWIQERVERPHESLPREEHLRILEKLNEAEIFETFLQTKFVGQRRFSLEGGESAIALMDEVCEQAAMAGLEEVCIGMPHRGRLNVLANIVGKSYGQIFREFEGNIDPRSVMGSGDVKYHLGAEGQFTALNGAKIRTSVAANPSHLEAVNPVLEGIARAKQDILDRGVDFPVLPVLMHGDAAFAGQGVVAETLNLSQLRGYRTGGTVHVVVNNQVGFTTSPLAARSSVYATDVARMIQAPIFHVNGDDPEACVRVARLAYEFRQEFKKDVVVDMICYRRRGHSEVDEPSFTQPLMYALIDAKRSVRKIYTESLIGRGDISLEEAESALRDYQGQLEKVFADARDADRSASDAPEEDEASPVEVATAVSAETVKRIADSQVDVPAGFTVHRRLLPQLQRRAAMVDEDSIDWAMGETIAFGSLLLEGRPVRLAGQDSRRGTFGQRHTVLVDQRTGVEHTPLAHLDDEQATFYVYDSLLSEFAAMGFEYGYSVARPEALVMWEAQFGDFAPGAQSIVDEFVAAGEEKWGQRSGVTLLLPHGYEGQGPDHSSARIERYLTLCAESNMVVATPTTPANYCHLLRRQALSPAHKPLIVFTPKSMLRLKAAVSPTEAFTSAGFAPVLADPEPLDAGSVTRVVLCAGKVFYDLAAGRRRRERSDTAIVRVEQLYPLPADEIVEALADYPNATDLAWVQEEPANMGAWPYMALDLPEHLDGRLTLRRISRRASASPAAGSSTAHEAEQVALLEAALGS